MNIVDYVVIGIVALSVLFGFYRGFVSSVLNMGGGLVSFGLSFLLYPKLADIIRGDTELVRTLLHYTDASSRIGDLELAITNVATMTREGIADLVSKVTLPPPFDALLQLNLETQAFSGSGVTTVADYVSQTILNASINILCFVVCFAALYIVISILINAIKAIFRFPVLKQLDWLAGGVFGFLRGILLCYAAFAIVPLILTMVPVDFVSQALEQSRLAAIFNNGNLILAIMNGVL
ncbi:MAG: CvpA family protein [Clostridia bacterium]|nr:CvpA family protein [Clostridia bacterium]